MEQKRIIIRSMDTFSTIWAYLWDIVDDGIEDSVRLFKDESDGKPQEGDLEAYQEIRYDLVTYLVEVI